MNIPFASLAQKNCLKSDHHQHYHCAIVVKGGSVVSVGYNVGTKHAEIQALNKMWPSERKGVTLYSFRFRKGGTWGMAKPCRKCESYLKENGVKVVYYTDENGTIKKMKL